MRESRDGETREIVLGIGLTFGLHIAVIVLLSIGGLMGGLGGMVMAALLFATIGVSQLLYVVPAMIIARRRGRPGVAKGVIVGAAITLILSGACWAVVNPFNIRIR